MPTGLVMLLRPLLSPFFMALGVTIGGALLGGLGQFLAGHAAPTYAALGWRIRLWAVAVAIGGAMTAIEKVEREILGAGLHGAVRDLAVVASAYAGAEAGYLILRWLVAA